ncbi:MAG: DMT family transporter [Ktedonobacterales bacterium]|nr:DMT family transporter [Ktedonobacterales bacterium]
MGSAGIPKPATGAAEQRVGIGLGLLAVGCFSVAPVFVLVANPPFSALEIAFWRVAIGAGFVGVLGLATRTAMRLGRGEWRRFVLYGLTLAIHLSAYVAALSFTSIAHAVALTYTSPIFIAVLAAIFLGERPRVGTLVGLAVALGGIALLSGFQPDFGQCNIGQGHCVLFGDGLALVAALFSAIYSLGGRLECERHPLFRYTFHVYGFAALWLLPVAAALAWRHGYPLGAVGAVAALGIVPLGMGHTLYNAALRRANPTLINLVITQEITGGIILGAIFLHQIPQPLTLVGVAITLVGIAIVMLNPAGIATSDVVE